MLKGNVPLQNVCSMPITRIPSLTPSLHLRSANKCNIVLYYFQDSLKKALKHEDISAVEKTYAGMHGAKYV
jgi:hypothetical protein